MGGAAVTGSVILPSTSGSSWKLDRDAAAQAQGLVTSGFGDLPAACALLLNAGNPGGGWLGELQKVAPVTAANGKSTPSVALAFTQAGLVQLGVPDDVLEEFSLPFQEGMLQKDRRRRLGDADEKGAPLATVEWGLRPEPADDEAPAPGLAGDQHPVHALLLVYHESHGELVTLVETKITPALSAAGVEVVRRLALDLTVGNSPDVREHFGFVDGISQPIPYGKGTDQLSPDPVHGVRLGEILLGYPDAHGATSSGPYMAGTAASNESFVPSTRADSSATAAKTIRNPEQQSRPDIGTNGTYLVVRELRQEVDAFWASMKAAAGALNAGDPSKPPVDAAWIAERVVGRTRDGHMLRPDGPLPPLPPVPPDTNGLPDNDFLYFQRDRHGYGCPLGSHVRRSNPRDGLAYEPGVCEDLLHSANAHRILRRGRKFGGGGHADDTQGKGLLFICLNSDIARQFEFVQQNWMLNPNFASLYDEVDPLVGPKGGMTLPAKPLRRRVELETFVKLVGGDYFFLPSIDTIRLLATLPARPATPKASS